MANELSEMIASLVKLQDTAATTADVAVVVKRDMAETLAAGTDAYGKAWPLVKSGERKGERALVDIAKAVKVKATEDTVTITVSGINARHHYGNVKGGTERPSIPNKDAIPDKMAADIQAALGARFAEIMSGK